jgi:hypothetical protein
MKSEIHVGELYDAAFSPLSQFVLNQENNAMVIVDRRDHHQCTQLHAEQF